MASSAFLKALGLSTQKNRLTNDPGSLLEAVNVLIRRENVIEPRRGFKLYGDSFGTSTDIAKQLFSYRDRILRHYSDTLQFQTNRTNSDGEVIFEDFAGSYTETEAGLRIKAVVSPNGNFYFTTSEGIKKISASSADEFTTADNYISQAGGIKALDVTARLNIEYGDVSSWFIQDSAVAYRVLWNIKDINSNVVPGTPSQRTEIYNPILTLMLTDFSRLLGQLDNVGRAGGGLVTDTDYVSLLNLPSSATASQLRTNLISLATKIDTDIYLANNTGAGVPLNGDAATSSIGVGNEVTLTFTAGDPTQYISIGDHVILSGFATTTGTINAAQLVTNVSATTITFVNATAVTGSVTTFGDIYSYNYRNFTQPSVPSINPTHDDQIEIQDYMESIILRLQSELTGVITSGSATLYIDPLAITQTATVFLNITVPPDVTLNHFYQIYRSNMVTATGTDVLTDLVPDDEMKLIYESYPTQDEIDSKEITVQDITIDSLRTANLYTNPLSGEGILQANDLPPFAKDINQFKNYTFYANTRTLDRFTLNLLGVSNLIDEYNAGRTPTLVISTEDGIDSDVYRFIVGENETTDITFVNETGVNYTSKYFTINSADDVMQYYVWYVVSGVGTDPAVAGKTGIKVLISTGDTGSTIATKTRDTLNTYILDFTSTASSAVLTVVNKDVGYCTDATTGNAPVTVSVTTQGTGEKTTQEEYNITCVADVAGSLAGTYFTINTAYNRQQYYVWYRVSGGGTDPMVANRTAVPVDITTNDSATNVASKTALALNNLNDGIRFVAESNVANLNVKSYRYGQANDAAAGTSGFTVTKVNDGALEVLLSSNASPAQAIDETARSLVSVINKNSTGIINAFYISSVDSAPGQMSFEQRDLNGGAFYMAMNKAQGGATVEVGDSFNPVLTPTNLITAISAANPTVITSTAHGLMDNDEILIVNSNSTPNVDGVYNITLINANTFSIQVNVTSAGNQGSWISTDDINIAVSDNEVRPNRVYYSKLQQPEAVPILNYLDIGPKDKAIKRIYPLRDSLMVFKEDGIYRISGEVAPFTVSIFDNSAIIVAPDSLSISNGLLYCWANQGIISISESGVSILSREIDVDILYRASSQFTNFKQATWGIGYDSENTYLVFTVTETDDEIANVCYVYNNLTQTWTTYDKTNMCGLVNPVDDKLYLGAGDTNFLEQERKNFNRTDYADREFDFALATGNYLNNGLSLALSTVDNIAEGDVLVQEQFLTIFEFNALLKKLDIDTGINITDFFSLLEASNGDDLRALLVALATKLDNSSLGFTDYLDSIDAKTGTITANTLANPTIITTSSPHELQTGRIVNISGSDSTPSIDGNYQVTVISSTTFSIPVPVTIAGTTGTFETVTGDAKDIEACYNTIISKLNLDPDVAFGNYSPIDTISYQECIITDVTTVTKRITVSQALPLVVGEFTVYKAINSHFIYTPNTFGDPLNLKHIRECTLMFEDNSFSQAVLSFATDLLPAFNDVTVLGDGNGLFGHVEFGEGYFGGISNSRPFRTYIPRNSQRCRYLTIKFDHSRAREKYSLNGVTVTGEFELSTRAYK